MVNLGEKDICRMYLSHMEDSVRPMSCLECSYSVTLEEKRKCNSTMEDCSRRQFRILLLFQK